VIQGRNPKDSVRRVLTRFGLSEHDLMKVKGGKKKHLPTEPTPVENFLLDSVELATPVTKRQLATLAGFAKEGSEEQKQLQAMQEDSKYKELLEKRFSVLDVLDDLAGLEVPFGVYVDMLQAMTPRQYSISSSPLDPSNNPGHKESADVASTCTDRQIEPRGCHTGFQLA
jgi:cytochrome P450 / NADPH-cytochrome P450 reductase